jgi:hypothetical protein
MAVIEVVNETMLAYEYAPASELKLTSLSEVLQAIRGLKVDKAPGPNGKPNKVLRHPPKHSITFLTKVFNAVLRWQYFPSAWKDARVVSILKPGKDPTLPSSYRLINLLDSVGKIFEKILLARVLREINELGFLRDEQFGLRAGVAQGGLVSPLLFSLYVNDIPTPSRHVELAQYADDTALVARSPSLLFGYLEDVDLQITEEKRWTGVLATGLEDCHQRLKQHCRALC